MHSIALLVLFLSWVTGCQKNEISNSYSETVWECGSNAKTGPYSLFKATEGKVLDGEEISAVLQLPEGNFLEIPISKKGCIFLSQVEKGKSLAIRYRRSGYPTQSIIIPPSLIGIKEKIPLARQRKAASVGECGDQFVTSGSLNLHNYFSVQELVSKSHPFYSIEAFLFDETQPTKNPIRSVSSPSLEKQIDMQLDGLEKGKYRLSIKLLDHVKLEALPEVSCSIDTTDYNLEVDIASKIERYRLFYGKKYGVVDDKYIVNFYVTEGLSDLDIDYCVVPIDPHVEAPILNCDGREVFSWKTGEDGVILENGFYAVVFRARKQQLFNKWDVFRVLVNKRCFRDFHSMSELESSKCNQVLGNVILDGPDIKNSKSLSLIGNISGELRIRNTSLKQLTLPNLSEVTILNIESNKSLEFIHAPNLNTIYYGATIKDNPSLKNLDAFSKVKTIGGILEIASNQSLQSLSGLDNLQALGSLILRGLTLNNNEGLDNLRQIYGDLKLESVDGSGLKDLDLLNNLVEIGGSLSLIRIAELFSLEGLTAKLNGSIIIESSPVADCQKLSFPKQISGDIKIRDTNFENLNCFEGVSEINGDLMVQNNDSLRSLIGLENLTHVEGKVFFEFNRNLNSLLGFSPLSCNSITIVGNSLWNLTGLESIESLEYLSIEDEELLTDFMGLDSLKKVIRQFKLTGLQVSNLKGLSQLTRTSNLVVNDNPKLIDFRGSRLSSIDELKVSGNYSLRSFIGLENITSVNSIAIENNQNLQELTGLHRLVQVDDVVSITSNVSLKSVSSLEALAKIGNTLQIGGNSLENLNGFEKVSSLNYALLISNEPQITNLIGLEGLQKVGAVLSVVSNPLLQSFEGLNLFKIGDPLPPFELIPAVVSIESNTSLQDINALENMTFSGIMSMTGNIIDSKGCPSMARSPEIRKFCMNIKN